MTPRIFLIGFMGSGKSTIGKLLADSLRWNVVDMDTFIEEKHFKTVGQLFEGHGEAKFREIERMALKEISQFENTVISTGGGCPCFFDNMQTMLLQGTCIYLKLSAEELTARLLKSQIDRPLIRGKNEEELLQFIRRKLDERESFYSQSQIIIDCSDKREMTIVQEIFEKITIFA